MTSNNRWFSREACERWWGVRMLGSIHNEKSRKAVRCTAQGKGFLFFLQIHITGEEGGLSTKARLWEDNGAQYSGVTISRFREVRGGIRYQWNAYIGRS